MEKDNYELGDKQKNNLLTSVLVSFLLIIGIINTTQSQGLPDLSGELPDLLAPLPDPAEILGVEGELYKEMKITLVFVLLCGLIYNLFRLTLATL